ncbi:hypothetical protein [Methanimicrococcus hongohii]|nr:hypothetical protein [Methanimicrococcus sp. Hf6]
MKGGVCKKSLCDFLGFAGLQREVFIEKSLTRFFAGCAAADACA